MKDPLQSEQTPYEVLELERGASDAGIDRAFKQGLVKRGNVQKLMAARNALQRPAERALLDLFQYDPQVASRLNPDPLADRSVLELARRQETAAAWEKQLRADFPDIGIVHSLAVLWYWWVLHIEGQQGSGGGPSLEEGWRRVIAYWAMLVGCDQFWSAQVAAGGGLASSVRAQVVERLRNNLNDLGQRYRDNREESGAGCCQRLELLLTTEVRTAKEVANVGLRTAQGRFACGLLMLEQMGLLDSVKQQLQTALEKNPTDEKLLALRNSLSPYASIAALIDNNKPQVALEAIAAREKEEISRLAYSFWEHRGRKGGWAEGDWKRAEGEFREKPEGRELSILRARAFHCLAKQQASLGKLEDALSSWELALKCRPDAELKSNILAETVSHCQARAAALQQREPETAIGILEMGLELTHDEKLRSLLAEILAQRGITTVNEAQRKREAEKTVDTCEIRNMLEKGQADLKRAAELGSERAKQNLPIASRLIELADSGLLDLSREAWTLFQQANEAANAGDLERAITLLEQAITTAAGKGQAALKSFLAEILAQRSIETFDEVQNKASQEKKITDKMLTDCEAALANLERASQLGCKRATDNLPIGRGVLAEILAQRSIETFNEAQEKAKQREITQQVLTDCRAALANLERASQLGSKRATENLPIARRVLEELRRPPEPPLPEKVARLLEQANQAAAMEDWDTAIAKLRQATKLAGSKPPDVLKKNLAASLANRAVGNANQAVEMMGDAAKAHGPGLSELFKSLQSQGLLRSSDECTFCGKSKYSSHGESWFGYELPDGRKVSLCGKCGSVAQDTFGSAPKPSPEAISLLQSAERDLSEAATLDPSSDHVRKNLSSAREILSKLGPAAPSTSKASRRASGERNNFHAVLVMLILVLACIVILISGEDYRQHGSAMWPNIWVGKLATILAWVIGLPFFLCASTGEINLWWDGLCKKSWKRKGGFAKFMEFLVFMFLISLILTFLAGKLR